MGSVCLSVFTQATLCTTTMVYGVLVHHQGAICTTKAQYAPWCTRETIFFEKYVAWVRMRVCGWVYSGYIMHHYNGIWGVCYFNVLCLLGSGRPADCKSVHLPPRISSSWVMLLDWILHYGRGQWLKFVCLSQSNDGSNMQKLRTKYMEMLSI